ELQIVPSYGSLTIKARVRNLSVFVDKVGLDPARRKACYGLRITSLSSDIPFEIKVAPRIDYGDRLALRFERVSVGLSRSNFYFHSVTRCDVFGPIDALIERMVPAIANTM